MSEAETCRALTADGSRCSRPARENGFCYQHDEDDPTVDEESEGADGEPSDEEERDEEEASVDEASNGETSNGQAERTEEEEHDMSESDDENGSSSPDLMTVRDTVSELASDVIGRPLDGIIEMSQEDGEWRAVVEVIERRSVPDTQDILGRYEVDVDDETIVGYRRLERYRRGDTTQHEL